MLTRHVEKHADMSVIEPVEDIAAITTITDRTSAPQQPQCLRHLRIRRPHHLSQIAHAQLACFQQRIQDPHPGGVTQQTEQLRQIRRHIHIDQRLGNDRNPGRVGRRHRTPIQS